VPVPLLKDKIATVTGILSEQQRLICRGRVLKDDELLSAYRILMYFRIAFLIFLVWNFFTLFSVEIMQELCLPSRCISRNEIAMLEA
jgi:hypothetical protein